VRRAVPLESIWPPLTVKGIEKVPEIDPRRSRTLNGPVARPSFSVSRRRGPLDSPATAPARPGANRRLEREVAYRDGLLLALLAACPLRRRSLALLEVGRHLVRGTDGYRLRLGPAETKNGTAYGAPLPASLAPWLDRYLGEVRPRLLGGRAGGCGCRGTEPR